MATPGTRHRRMVLLSAPPLSCLPRMDSHQLGKELSLFERRQETARLRRSYLNSRRHDYVENTRKAEIERMKRYKIYLDNMKLLNQINKEKKPPREDVEESVWQREITKIDIPERLPIALPVRLTSAREPLRRSEHLPNTTPMFYHVNISATRRNGSTVIKETSPVIKQKLQYFINREWSSERVSWNHFHKHVPEFLRTNGIC